MFELSEGIVKRFRDVHVYYTHMGGSVANKTMATFLVFEKIKPTSV